MTIIISILSMIGISLLGSLLYSVIDAKKYFKPKIFSIKIFLRENIFTWLYSFLICGIIATIINLIPNTATAIQSATGLSVSNEIASFLTLGYALCASMEKDKLSDEDKNKIIKKDL